MGIGNDLIGDIETLLVNRVINLKRLFRFSQSDDLSYCSRFEYEVSMMYHNSYCLLVPSASIGLLALLKSFEIPRGSEILLPPFSWKSNYAAINIEGHNFKFININEKLELDINSIKEQISSNTRMVIIPHLMGRAQKNIKAISKLCKKNGLILIEDISQSFGVHFNGQMVGTFGDASYSSLNHHKIISTGDGGFVIVKNIDVFKKLMSFHDQGCIIKNGKRFIPENTTFGTSLRVSDLVGAVAYAQITKFHLIKTRVLNLYRIVQGIMNTYDSIIELEVGNGDIPYFFLFGMKDDRTLKMPSLRDSGWHSIEKIDTIHDSIKRDKLMKLNFINLSKVYSIGTGLVDKYYATEFGLKVFYSEEEIDQLKLKIKELII